jgi:hypothetical protein
MFRVLIVLLSSLTLAPVAGAQGSGNRCASTNAPALGTSGPHLTIDGRQTFIVLASYFDAMRAPVETIEGDFAFLRETGIRGIRIFPLWVRDDQDPAATLLDATGRVRSDERWRHFEHVLNTAARCGMIVDLTFNREMLTVNGAPMSLARYQTGIVDIVERLDASGRHPHVFIDLQNERNRGIPGMDYSTAEIRRLRDAVKAADPERLVMCSTLGGVKETIALVTDARLDVAAFHEDQRQGWHGETAANVRALAASARPVYLQEMARAPDRGVDCIAPPGSNALIDAVRAAKQAGAAAWTFHTDAGFRLDREQFQDEIRGCAQERAFLDALAGAID